jgi:ribonucleotide monophosphatase NagD (HAD superfamily)
MNILFMCVMQAIPGAADVIKHLKAAGVPYKFVTNTTTDKRAGAQHCHHTTASQHAQ